MENTARYNPGLVIWEITLRCNLRCKHCGSSAGKPRNDELSTNESLKLCDDLEKIGFKGVTLFGGEPFQRNDWYLIGKKIKDLGMKLSVVTNGFIEKEDIITKLIDLEVDSVQVGLDGASSNIHDYIRGVNGSFDKAVEFLRLLKASEISSGAITTVSKMNFKDLNAIKQLIINEGFDWQIQEAIPIGRFPKNMVLSEDEYYSLGLFVANLRRKYISKGLIINGPHNFGFYSKYLTDIGSSNNWDGCWAGKRVLGIQSDGGVKGCLALSDDFIEGNIRRRSIIDIWDDPTIFSFNRNFKKEDLGKNCKDCKYSGYCKGGCSTRSHCFTGIVHNDPFCFHRIEEKIIR